MQAMVLSQKLASLPQKALMYTKQLLKLPANTIDQRIKQESVILDELINSEEAKAIFQAFLNR